MDVTHGLGIIVLGITNNNKNIHYDSFDDLPIILLNNYDEIKDIDNSYNFYDKNLKKLNIKWWLDQLKLRWILIYKKYK